MGADERVVVPWIAPWWGERSGTWGERSGTEPDSTRPSVRLAGLGRVFDLAVAPLGQNAAGYFQVFAEGAVGEAGW